MRKPASLPSRLYAPEYTPNLLANNWLALPLVRSLGTLQTITDPAPAGPQRFYRVRQW